MGNPNGPDLADRGGGPNVRIGVESGRHLASDGQHNSDGKAEIRDSTKRGESDKEVDDLKSAINEPYPGRITEIYEGHMG